MLVSGYQFAITIGIMLASIVVRLSPPLTALSGTTS